MGSTPPSTADDVHAGRVDQDVDPAELFVGPGEKVGYAFPVGDVGGPGENGRLAAEPFGRFAELSSPPADGGAAALAARATAMAAPMPVPPPVTRAVLFFRSMISGGDVVQSDGSRQTTSC